MYMCVCVCVFKHIFTHIFPVYYTLRFVSCILKHYRLTEKSEQNVMKNIYCKKFCIWRAAASQLYWVSILFSFLEILIDNYLIVLSLRFS